MTETEIDWQAVLLAYMRHVFAADDVIANPAYPMGIELKSALPPCAYRWLSERWQEMLKADEME
jgi:hypothetical protein